VTVGKVATMKKRVLIFVVCYNAERFVEGVLQRIPAEVWHNDRYSTEVLIIDDESEDRTFHKANEYALAHPELDMVVLSNARNQGYGGNQKIGYHYAIKNAFDAVVLMHGDGQYPPEYIDAMLHPILSGEADAVFGSRMINKKDALKGGMPLYKWLANQLLTTVQNRILNARLSEFHTGYRAYSVPALASVPFAHNADGFDFDTDIIIQLLQTGRCIKEIPIPTFYGEEISRVSGVRYALAILRSSMQSRVVPLGILYTPKFDYASGNSVYSAKFGYASSHQFALDRVSGGASVLNIGCGPGFMARELAKQGVKSISIDRQISDEERAHAFHAIQADLDEFDYAIDAGKIDYVLLLDIIEHMRNPDALLRKIRDRFSRDAPQVIVTTANVGFAPVRASLLLGQFNYGKRGILDLDHKRLFTFSSMRRLLEDCGYEILEEKGIPAPYPLAFGDGWFSRFLLTANVLLIRLSKRLFSYQMAFVARPRPTLEHLLDDALRSRISP